MRTLSSVLRRAAPRSEAADEEPESLDAILRSFLEEPPRWRSRRVRRVAPERDAREAQDARPTR